MLLLVLVGDEDIQHGDEGNADEKADVAGSETDFIKRLMKQLGEGDIEHDAGGKAENQRHAGRPGLAHEIGDSAADAGGQPGKQGQEKSKSYIT